ncbi:MAG: hypothetical protein GTO02_07425 [Candidatus Dadabacteria bacterium]|nr:hypothetical protein [Candidatus Dadabacteria bacterium]NIQ14226.1 hypothetical protein [Candidatus Dadabacteria bacterium]
MKIIILICIAIYIGYLIGRNKNKKLKNREYKTINDKNIIDAEVVENENNP